jgi:hypothetical protein
MLGVVSFSEAAFSSDAEPYVLGAAAAVSAAATVDASAYGLFASTAAASGTSTVSSAASLSATGAATVPGVATSAITAVRVFSSGAVVLGDLATLTVGQRVRIAIGAMSMSATITAVGERVAVADIADLDAVATIDATGVRVFSLTNDLPIYWDVHYPVSSTYRPSWSRIYPVYPAVRETASIRNVTLEGG